LARVSQKQFIQALINNEANVGTIELSRQLNISKQYFYKLRDKYQDAIIQAARRIAVNYAVQAVKDLIKQSQQGKTVATTMLLEIAKVKEPENILATPGSWRISIEKIAPEHQVKQVESAEIVEIETKKGEIGVKKG